MGARLSADDDYEAPHGRQGLEALGKEGVGLLADVPLFSGLTKRQLRRVAELAQQVEFPSGAMVVTAGAPGGSAFFVIAPGEAKVVRNKQEITRLGPGSSSASSRSSEEGRRNASVIAEERPDHGSICRAMRSAK